MGEHQKSILAKTGETYNEKTERVYEFSKNLPNSSMDIKLFKRRWLQLALLIVCGSMINMQWFQYTVCSNIVQRYWGVSSWAIEWTSMIYIVVFLITLFPVSHLVDRVGLRWTCLIAAGGTFIGGWIKVLSVSPDLFIVTFIGQIIVALSQVVIYAVPGRLAAYWFGPKEVALATIVGCYGIPVGLSVCFIATTRSIKNHENIVDIGDDLYKYFITLAIISTIILVLILLFFQDEPPLSPSFTRALQKANRETGIVEGFWPPLKRILTNRSFIMLWNAYGPIACMMGTFGTVLNPLYLAHFENGEVDVGNLGLVWNIAGSIGATFFAFILDKTKKFKMISIIICISALLSQAMFAISMIMGVKWMVFVSCAIWGVFVVGYTSLGFDLCAETTYPEPEGVALGTLNLSSQVYGAVVTMITGRMIEIYGDKAGHACMIASVAIGTIFVTFGRFDPRRLKAAQLDGSNDVSLQILKPEKTGLMKPFKRESTDVC